MKLLSQSSDCGCVWETTPNHRIHSPCDLTVRCESESVASRVVSEQQGAWEYHAIACLEKARLARALMDSEMAYPEYEPLRHQLEATLHSIDKDEWEMRKNSLLKQYGLL